MSDSTQTTSNNDSKKLSNPYLQSRLLWNDLYGSIQDKLQNAYRVIFILAAVIVIAIFGLVLIAAASKVRPYIALLHGNEIVTVSNFNSAESEDLKPKLASLLTQKFITYARNRSIDSDVDHANYIAAFSYASGGVTGSLKEFMAIAGLEPDQTRLCIFKTVLLKAAHTIEIHWDEELRDNKSGQRISVQSYSADVTYQFDRVSNDPVIAQHNPLGFYVTSLVWSKDLVNAR